MGKKIDGLDNLGEGVIVFHAGTATKDGATVTAGGRVLGVTAIYAAADFRKTIDMAYTGVSKVSFEGMQYRRDIGKRAVMRSVGSMV